MLGESSEEGLSLLQVGARRLVAASKTDGGEANSAKEPPASANALAVLQVVETATRTKARVSAALGQGVSAVRGLMQTRSSYTLSIVIVAVVGLVALCLLALALQPSHTARDNLHQQGSISQNFPRAHNGPYGRQGSPTPGYYSAPEPQKPPGYNLYGPDMRPSVYARDSFQPPTAMFPPEQQTDRDGRPLPRVSTNPRLTPKPSILPRVQSPPTRPGTGLGITPAHSIMQKQQDIDEGYPGAMASAPELRPPEVTGFAPRRPPP